MQKEDYFIILFSAILITGLYYFYQNLGSFECFMQNTTRDVMSDIKYEFEPNGSLYGKTKIYRFNIISSGKNLEYYGMKITNGDDVLFFQAGTNPEGGSIVATLVINETDVINVDRFFKKKCYSEVRL
jgi:hypothetical protein